MRRKDKKIEDSKIIEAILTQSQICHIAFWMMSILMLCL